MKTTSAFNMAARQRTEVRAERHSDTNTYQATLAFAICPIRFQSFPDQFVGAAFQHPPIRFANRMRSKHGPTARSARAGPLIPGQNERKSFERG
jgi:hypothetical protein